MHRRAQTFVRLAGSFSKVLFLLGVLFVVTKVHIPSTSSYFLSSVNSNNNQIQLKADWTPPPVPQLRSPLNNIVMNSANLKQAWTFVIDDRGSNPVTYYYESCAVDPRLYPGHICPAGRVRYTATYTNAQMQLLEGEKRIVKNAGGAPDGIFWWRVKAVDTLGNESAWSDVWKLTLDSTKPAKPKINTIYKGHNQSTWKELGCGGVTNDTQITVVWNQSTDPNIDYYWFGTKSNPKHAKVYHPVVQYRGNMTPGNNPYYYTIIAVDKAGNESVISEQCGLTLDTSAPATVSLSITGSYTKTLSEKVENGGFESGLNGWETADTVETVSDDSIGQPSGSPDLVITPFAGSSMAKVGNWQYAGDNGNMVWENRLMQSISGGAKSLSLHYNYVSKDYAADNPGFFIRLNGNEVFETDYDDLSAPKDGDYHATGWKQFYYDLSDYADTENVNLAVYAGNTLDDQRQSLAYVDEVTTYFLTAPEHAVYTLTGSDAGSGISHYRYKIGGGEWQTTDSTFQVKEHGNHWIEYYAVDKAGNESPVYRVYVITDTQGPGVPIGLTVVKKGANFVSLNWTAPGNDGYTGRAARYDIRYSLSPITDEGTFETATPAAKMPVPQTAGETDNVEILGLNPDTLYYFAVRAADEAPNWSAIATVSDRTDEIEPGETVTYGDIIINELMWMGSSVSQADEWIELRNMTDRDINLKDFKIEKYDGSEYDPMITLPDKIIPAKGYFLISNFAPGSEDSQLKSGVVADYVTTAVDLNAGHLQLQLIDAHDNPVDEAWDYAFDLSDGEGEGLHDNASLKYYSMERTSVPGDGTDPLSWYTCIDEDSKTDFFTAGTAGSDVRGTPGYENRSENEPYSRIRLVSSPTPTATSTPSAKLILSEGDDSATIKIENIGGFTELVYILENRATGKAIADNSASPEKLTGQDVFEASGIILETCSGGVCTKMTDTENLRLEVALTDKEGKEIRIESGL